MASVFPGALDSFATNRTDGTVMSVTHPADHNDPNDAINKIEAKVGTGSSTPAANTVLGGTAAGASAWNSYVSVGTNPSTTGAVRLANNERVIGRNAANSTDIVLIFANTSDEISLGNGSVLRIPTASTRLAEGANLVLGTTTGTKIGTATTQKIGFFNATPIVQPSTTGETVGFTAGAGTAVNDQSTFTGNVGATAYRISDIVKHLKNLGLIAA